MSNNFSSVKYWGLRGSHLPINLPFFSFKPKNRSPASPRNRLSLEFDLNFLSKINISSPLPQKKSYGQKLIPKMILPSKNLDSIETEPATDHQDVFKTWLEEFMGPTLCV